MSNAPQDFDGPWLDDAGLLASHLFDDVVIGGGELARRHIERTRELRRITRQALGTECTRRVERIDAHPRVYVPFPAGTIIPPGNTVQLQIMPQVPIGPPYFLGIVGPHWMLRSLLFGMHTAAMCSGELPAELLEHDSDRVWPEGLVPIDAPTLHLGCLISLTLRNDGSGTRALTGGLWGTALPAERPFLPPAPARRQRLERELLPLLEPPKDSEREAHEQRCLADRRVTQAALEPYEDGDVWESPTDES